MYFSVGNYKTAESLFKKVIEINQIPKDHPDFAACLNNLALLYKKIGNYEAAKPLYKEALNIFLKAYGENHDASIKSFYNLASLYCSLGNYTDAKPMLEKAIEIGRRVLGEKHSDFANLLFKLSDVYDSTGNYVEAELFIKQAIDIKRENFGEQHPDYAGGLNGLALTYYWMGNYAEAETLYKQAIEIYKSTLGNNHPDLAISLNNLAMLYSSISDYSSAEALYKQALKIKRVALGEKHPDYASSLNNLAVLFKSIGKLGEAERLYKQSMEIRGVVLGEQHVDFLQSLNNLAALYSAKGEYDVAVSFYKRAIKTARKILGEQHPDLTPILNNFAVVNKSMGNYNVAESLYNQVIEISRVSLGEQHPHFAISLNNLAALFALLDKKGEAEALMKKASAIQDYIIGQVFSIGSESQRRKFVETIRVDFDAFLSLIIQNATQSSEELQYVLSLILRRKAITAEALIAQRDAVLSGKNPHLEQQLQKLSKLREQIALKTLAGAGQSSLETHNQILTEWESQKEELESELARQIPEINLEQKLREIDREVVAMALPENSALVEFVRFDVFDFKAVPARGESQWKPAHYLAFVMAAKEPDNLQMIDLGEAEPIDAMIATFRAAITDEEEGRGVRDLGNLLPVPDSELYVEKGKELRKILFDKLLDGIGDCKRLFISPDGDLTRLPFETLPTDDGEFLIDKYHISYLSVGRDVLRFDAASSGEPTAPLIIADPDFNLAGKDLPPSNEQTSGRISRDFDRSNLHFTPLPGTRIEGENIAEMLDVKPLLSTDALESSLKACQSPRILHIATHGFFLKDEKRDLNKDRRDLGMLEMSDNFGMGRFSASNLENPLLRSGLALAGVNTWLKDGVLPEEAEDGILTAEDVSGLDLLATELVVLSACETGLGEINVGEGVFGLRRAFVLAGAKTLVMSLWKVPDKQTQELMESFYQKILAGQPRSKALREAQLEIRKKYPHPADWGAFICQGNPNQLTHNS